jgi:hypothetical protein
MMSNQDLSSPVLDVTAVVEQLLSQVRVIDLGGVDNAEIPMGEARYNATKKTLTVNVQNLTKSQVFEKQFKTMHELSHHFDYSNIGARKGFEVRMLSNGQFSFTGEFVKELRDLYETGRYPYLGYPFKVERFHRQYSQELKSSLAETFSQEVFAQAGAMYLTGRLPNTLKCFKHLSRLFK